jgi:hypothetical protein
MPAIVFASTCKNKITLSLTLLYLIGFRKSGTVLLLLNSTPIVIGQQFEEVVRLYQVQVNVE